MGIEWRSVGYAAASLPPFVMHEGVGLLGGASTIPRFRRRGAQQAIMDARLDYALRAGCDLAMISAGPHGGGSERNAARQGFHTALASNGNSSGNRRYFPATSTSSPSIMRSPLCSDSIGTRSSFPCIRSRSWLVIG